MVKRKPMETMKLDLSDAQLRKLAKGQGIMLKPAYFNKGHGIQMSAAKYKKLHTAMNKGKGMRLTLGQDELGANDVEMSGGKINWKKLGRQIRGGLKEAGKFYRKEVRPTVGPALEKLTKKGLEVGTKAAVAGLASVTGQPALLAAAPATSKFVSEKGTKAISKLTGAYGVKKGKKKSSTPTSKITEAKSVQQAPLPYKVQLQDNYSNFLNPNHPAQNPRLAQPDNSLPRNQIYGNGLFTGKGGYSEGGGGYSAGGGGYSAGGMLSGLPDDPVLSQRDNSIGTPRYDTTEPNTPSTSFF